jgi:hypothetical protein
MLYQEQFYIGKIPVWIPEVDGTPLKKTSHPRNYLFPSIIQNRDHAQGLLDHFGLISIDLREDFKYRIFAGSGIAVDSMLCRNPEHRVVKPPPFPHELLGWNLFHYLCDAEAVLARLQLHFGYLVERLRSLPKEVRGELSNIAQPVWQDTERMKALTTGLLEKPRRRTSLTAWLESNSDLD